MEEERRKVDLQSSESYFVLAPAAPAVGAPEKSDCTLLGKVHKKQMVCFVINIWVFPQLGTPHENP